MVSVPDVIRVVRLKWLAATLVLAFASQMSMADVVAVVSSSSSITALSDAQLAEIFLGKVSRAPNGMRIVPIDQAEDSVEREQFYARIAGRSAAQMKSYWSKIIFTGRGQPPQAINNVVELRRRIAGDPSAIGYIEASQVDDSLRVVR
jgi:ABC-type phosphate transport system substrate-binding protein